MPCGSLAWTGTMCPLRFWSETKVSFLGLGSCPAKVQVSYGPEEEEEVLAPAPAPKEKPQEERPYRPQSGKAAQTGAQAGGDAGARPGGEGRQSAPDADTGRSG